MCGLVAVVGDICNSDKKMFDMMLKLDTYRGPHSTGVCYIKNHDRQNPIVVKGLGTPWDLINEKRKEYMLSENDKEKEIKGDLVVMMGHNRWATVGKVSEENAHPFVANHLVGMQNGTITDYFRKKYDPDSKFETDTEGLFNAISKEGLEVFKRIEGAWALNWYDKENDTFNIMRNKERPLFYAWKKNKKVMYVASVADIIYHAAEIAEVELDGDVCYTVPTGVLFSYTMGKPYQFGPDKEAETDVPKYEAPKVVYKEPKVTSFTEYMKNKNGGYTTVVHLDQMHKSAADSTEVFKGTVGAQKVDNANSSFFAGSLEQSVKSWQAEVGTFKEFSISDGVFKDEQGKKFLLGCTTKGNVQIRIYPTDKVDIMATFGQENVSTYTAKIKRVKTNGKRFYLTIDAETAMICSRTSEYYRQRDKANEDLTDIMLAAKEARSEVAQAFDDIFVGEQVMLIANGEVVTPQEYDRRVSNGCAWCTSTPSLADAPHVHWMNREDFLCADCASDKEILQYCGQYA